MDEIQWWESTILEKSIIVIPALNLNIVDKDPDDNKFIEAAVEGKADYVVTQDKHLLEIKQYTGINIITPEEFLQIIHYKK